MHSRQAVDFLRRRYAHAILRDDAPTAGRLRDQLDSLMNGGGKRAGVPDPMALAATTAEPSGQADLFGRLACVSGRVTDEPEVLAGKNA